MTIKHVTFVIVLDGEPCDPVVVGSLREEREYMAALRKKYPGRKITRTDRTVVKSKGD